MTEKKTIGCSGISEIIDINRLEHGSREVLCLGFVVAIMFLFVVSFFIKYERITVKTAEQRIIKLRFIELPMTDPYHLKKPLRKKSLSIQKKVCFPFFGKG